MIASLRGILLEKNLDTVVSEAGGVGYAVTVTAAARRALPPAGLHVRIDRASEGNATALPPAGAW
jgi:Holliday junction resolvasome RuvABC DNA-binding subunit